MPLKTYGNISPDSNSDTAQVGVDEVGRGPAFGRLYTAAAIWPKDLDTPEAARLVKDSKLIKRHSDMERSYNYIIQNAVDYEVDYATIDELYQLGPLHADMLSMKRALDRLMSRTPCDSVLVDGNYFKTETPLPAHVTVTTVVKGDSKYYSIAAASILAKYTRDKYIFDMCDRYPVLERYGIRSNKGYLSEQHRRAIQEHGVTDHHRLKYKCCAGRYVAVLVDSNERAHLPKIQLKIQPKNRPKIRPRPSAPKIKPVIIRRHGAVCPQK